MKKELTYLLFSFVFLVIVCIDINAQGGGKAVYFDGTTNGNVQFSSPVLNTLPSGNAFTISFWFKADDPASGIQILFENWDAAHTGGISLQLRSDRKMHFYYRSFIISNKTINPNQWYYFTLVYDGGLNNPKMYFDGILDASDYSAYTTAVIDFTNPATVGNLHLGARDTYFFKGFLDELRIYNSALTQYKIRLYHHLIINSGIESTLSDYWSFNTNYSPAVGSNSGTAGSGATLITSTAPVGIGTCIRQSVSAAASPVDFGDAKLHLTSGSGSSHNVFVTYLNNQPAGIPTTTPGISYNKYWIIEGYGAAYSASSIQFDLANGAISPTDLTTPSNIKIFSRVGNDDSPAAWTSVSASGTQQNSVTLTGSFSQTLQLGLGKESSSNSVLNASIGPVISISPTTFVFYSLINSFSNYNFSISNSGDGWAYISNVNFSGTSFTTTSSLPIIIAPSATPANLGVRFAPVTVGVENPDLTIAYNNSPAPDFTNTGIYGVGIDLNITQPSNTITGVSILPEFHWTCNIPAPYTIISYDLQINGGSTPFIHNTGTSTSYQLSETDFLLLNNHEYTWTISVNIGLFSFTSASSSFKTALSAKATLSNPSNGATVYVYQPAMLSWSFSQPIGALTFTVEYFKHSIAGTVPTAADWTTGTTSLRGITDLFTNADLLSGTKYWWRVKTFRGSELISVTNPQWFKTSGGAAAVVAIPSSPIGGAKVYTNNPICYWYTNSGDLNEISFDLEVSNNTAFSNASPNRKYVYHTTDLNAEVTDNLTPGTTYYWRVITYYQYVSSLVYTQIYTPATYASFKTNGSGTVIRPVLSYPVGGVTLYTTTPVLYWYLNGSSDGLLFDVTVNGHVYSDISDLFLDLSTVSTSAGLTGGGIYNWFVTAKNSTTSLPSATGSFKIAGGIAQGKPVVSNPVNTTIYTTTPVLSWYVSGSTIGIQSYKVAFSLDESKFADITSFNSIANIHNSSGIYTSGVVSVNDPDARFVDLGSETPSPLGYGLKYYWGVVSFNGTQYSSISKSNFTVTGTTGSIRPIASYPKGGVTIPTTSTTLYWSVNGSTTGISKYEVIWSQRADMDITDHSATFVQETTDQSYFIENLVPGATYRWKVRSFNGTSYSDYSTPIAVFTVASGSSAVMPVAGSPDGGVSLTTNSPELSWCLPTMPSTNLKFEIQYSTDEMLNVDVTTIAGIPNASKVVSGLQPGKTYFWKVRSVDEKGVPSAYSNTAQFSVNSVNAVQPLKPVPTQFALGQNYPNPFNPSTIISYTLPQNSFVIIKIYDMIGREIKTLVNDNVSAGYHSVEWNADDNNSHKVASGTYLYRMTANNVVISKKLTLIK